MSATQEITLTIIGSEVSAEHPELHHYTDASGLQGIVRSNTLWATHYADLNDSHEIIQLRDPLRAELITRFREIIQRKRRSSLRLDRAVRATGGLTASATGLADDLIHSLYESAFENGEGETSPTAGSPLICSLCTHTSEPYERKNGLLSQWRGYGRGGGFCLVFDTARLGEMLGQEFDSAAYTHLNLHTAHYAFENISLQVLFPDLIATCDRFVETVLENRPELGDAIAQFFIAATVLKHQAFYEEREVRIVAIPITQGFRALVEAEYPNANLPPPKQIRLINRPLSPKRYIALFENTGTQLPIKRVIVGPSSDQASQVALANELSGGTFPIVSSETPYRG